MATTATLTINAEDIIGADFDRSRASVWVEANTEHGLIVVDGTNVRVGGRRENLVDGVATFNLVTTNSADNPTSFGYRVTITYVPKGSRKQGHDTITTSDFPFTSSANLAAIDEAWDNVTAPVEWRSAFRDEMEDVRAEAQAALEDAQALVITDLGTTDGQTKVLVETPASQTAQAIKAVLAARDTLNILDYGVTRGTTSSQTVAIKAALDANPGKAFKFPRGDYRLDTGLVVSANNTLVLDADARLYAAAAMGTLVNYDNGQASVSSYAQDKGVIGYGTLDAALLADKALEVSSVIRFSIDGLTIKDPIRRGVHLKSRGAEVIMRNVRMHNTGTTNSHKEMTASTTNASTTLTRTAGDSFVAADVGSPVYGAGIPAGAYVTAYTNANTVTLSIAATATASVTVGMVTNIAIDAEMGDSHFGDIVTRDFTIGIWNRNGTNVWNEVHPWLGDLSQLTVRYPYSVGFKIANTCTLDKPYVDTYRYGFQGDGTFFGVQITNPRFYCNSNNLSAALATTYPGAIFDCGTAGQRMDVLGGQYSGHSSFNFPFVTGNSRRFHNRSGNVLSAVSGFGEYRWGVKIGGGTFTPTLTGTTGTGTHTATAFEGYYQITDGGAGGAAFIDYWFKITATIGAGTTGSLQIGGFPYPVGATALRTGVGSLNRSVGIDATALFGSNAAPSGPPWDGGPQVAGLWKNTGGTAPVAVAAPAAGTVVDIWGTYRVPYLYSQS